MPRVIVHNNNFEKAMRKFKKKVMAAGIIEDVRAKQFFEKPAQVKLRKKAAAKARWAKKLREDKIPPQY